MKQEKSFRADLTKLRYNQHFLAVAILFLVSVVFWVGFEMFESQHESKISPQQLKLATPLNPVLDVAVVDELEKKPYFSSSELTNFTIYKLVSMELGEFARAIPIEQDESTLEPLEPTPAPASLLGGDENATGGAAIAPVPTPEPDGPTVL